MEWTLILLSLSSSKAALLFFPNSILSSATRTEIGFALFFLIMLIDSSMDEPEEITSSTISPSPERGLPINEPESPCFFSSLRLEEKGLSTENRLFNCKDIEEAKVIPLYAGPNIKSKFNSLCCM